MNRIPLALALLLSSSLTHANCSNYGAAGMVCTDGVTQHYYSGGKSIANNGRWNSGSTHRYEGGYVSITPNSTAAPSVTPSGNTGGLNVGSRVIPYTDPFAR
jgi:hypothetical protein